MNTVPVFTNVVKLQVKPNANNAVPTTTENLNSPQDVSVTSDAKSITNSDSDGCPFPNLRAGSVVKVKPFNATDVCLRGESLQQLSTNALPPYTPPSPPSPAKRNPVSFEAHCCSDCGDMFTLKSSLTFHLDRRSVLIKYPCLVCKRVCIFYNRCNLQSHIRSHADKNEASDIAKAVVNPLPRVLMDGLQTEFVNTLDDELNSMEDVDVTTPTELLECSFNEVDGDAIVVKEKSIVPGPKVKCIDCNEEFDSPEARRQHLTNGNKIPVLTSQCNKCSMVCPSKCSLKAHQRIHLQVSPYICPECGDSPDVFWANFQHHVKYKCFHNARGIGYKCPVCKRMASSNESLLKHMELHTEKYMKCEYCPRAYMTKSSLEDHIKENHPGRNVIFNSIFKCSLCDIVFLTDDQMLAHRSTHLKEQICEYVFNCLQCGKPLENKDLLLSHIKTCHPKIYKHITQGEQKQAKAPQPAITYKGKIECLLCHCSFHSHQGYSVHVSRAHINVNQPCSYCYMIIGNRREMVIHGKKHLKKGNIVCLLCNNKKYLDENSLDAHLAMHVDKLQYCSSCPICNELMPSLPQTLNHLRTEHFLLTKEDTKLDVEANEKTENVICHFCRISFDHDSQLQEHLKMKHSFLSQSEPNCLPSPEGASDRPSKKRCVERNVCAKCDFRSDERDAFKKHLLSHKTNKSTFQCQQCGLCFVVEPALVKHLRIIHKISDTKKYIEEEGTNYMPEEKKATEIFSCDSLICSVCYTTFPSEAALKTHMRSHGMAFIQANKTNVTL